MRTDRAAWLRTTALAGWLLSASVPAFAQALPTPGDAIRNTASGGDIAIIANPTPATLQVDLRARNTVIEWAGFSVPEGSTATFRDGRADGIAGTNPIAVLNRVVATPAPTPTPSPNFSESFSTFAAPAAAAAAPGSAPAISQILGALNSDPNVSVFLINPTGILFGPNANVSVGALVASTLALSDTEFFGTDGFDFTGGGGSIQVDAGARITAASTLTTGAVALIAAAIDTRGTLSASGDVAIVSASDVNLVFQPGSPLSLTIQRGTALNAPMVARGTIAGRNVLFAAATQATVTEIDPRHPVAGDRDDRDRQRSRRDPGGGADQRARRPRCLCRGSGDGRRGRRDPGRQPERVGGGGRRHPADQWRNRRTRQRGGDRRGWECDRAAVAGYDAIGLDRRGR